MQSSRLDELDLAIISALQIAPRARWGVVGKVLGISPVTAARRWERLVGEGLAWVTCIPGPSLWCQLILGFVEIDCAPAALPGVVDRLARDPRAASIEVVAGNSDLVLTVFAADLPTLSHFLLNVVSPLDGVRAARTRLGTGVYAEGAQWRLDALTPDQQAGLARAVPIELTGAPQDFHRELLLACSADGRRSAVELAELTGFSPSTVRRRLDRMVRERVVSFRCEVASSIAGWPISATFWANVPPHDLEQTARALVTLPQVRLCAALTGGPANLVITLWLRSVSDSQRVEELLVTRFADLRITDRAVALQIPKRIGWLLDESGRCTLAVPIDPWHDPDASRPDVTTPLSMPGQASSPT